MSDPEVPQVLELENDRFREWEADLRRRRETRTVRGDRHPRRPGRRCRRGWTSRFHAARPPHQRVFDVELAGVGWGRPGCVPRGSRLQRGRSVRPHSRAGLRRCGPRRRRGDGRGARSCGRARTSESTRRRPRLHHAWLHVPSLITWVRDWPSGAQPVEFPGAPTAELAPITDRRARGLRRGPPGGRGPAPGAGGRASRLGGRHPDGRRPGAASTGPAEPRAVVPLRRLVDGRVVAEVWQSVQPGVSYINYLRVPPALRG